MMQRYASKRLSKEERRVDALKFAEGKTDDAKVYNDEMIKAAQRAQDYIDGKNRNGFRVFETVEEAMDDLLNEKD